MFLHQRLVFATVFNRLRMDPESLEDVRKLFARLRDAKEEASKLKLEVSQIEQQIASNLNRDIFKQFLQPTSDSTDSPQPVAKKIKLNHSIPGDNDRVIVYVDGACENNGKKGAKAGIGAWFGDNHPLNISQPVNGKATNNVAEIQACIEAINKAKSNGIDKLKIVTDSQFTIDCMTKWIFSWKRRNWKLAKGGAVKNQELIKQLDRCCESIDLKWEHVPGHKGIWGNEQADRLARLGAETYVE